MKDRPILFSGAMVRAILDGRKMQTRRAVKPQPVALALTPGGAMAPEDYGKERLFWHRQGIDLSKPIPLGAHVFYDAPKTQTEFVRRECPYGAPGDRLWVRETWGPCAGGVVYRADDGGAIVRCPDGGKWRPSIHMPRWASRLTLAVAAVRVERLHDISEEDARAEGLSWVAPTWGVEGFADSWNADPRESFRALWTAINGAESWQANQWVWVVTFRRVQP